MLTWGFLRSRAFLASVAARLPGGSPLRLRPPRLAPRRPGLPGSRSALAVLRSSFRRLIGAATLLRFSHLVSVPRASSRSVPGLRRTVPVTSLLPERRSKGRPLSSPGGLAEGISVPDSGRHPTLDASIRAPQEPRQILERKRVTRSVLAPCKLLDHGALRFST